MSDKVPEQAKQTRSVVLQMRITPRADTALSDKAEQIGRSKADTARLLMTYGLAHMPEGYTGR